MRPQIITCPQFIITEEKKVKEFKTSFKIPPNHPHALKIEILIAKAYYHWLLNFSQKRTTKNYKSNVWYFIKYKNKYIKISLQTIVLLNVKEGKINDWQLWKICSKFMILAMVSWLKLLLTVDIFLFQWELHENGCSLNLVNLRHYLLLTETCI